ncbi:MAG: alpha-amylase family glycosyl hydrolase [Sphaerochaeta associata]|uniref:alpha-amylase family glycosyl hydrolase n=1 Tax=Sphaerochaeta associata TaxID=1129264 RepID=UPI002B219838|nr:alpha-amylase family glycosyl hydrolase [Sphaerochaeta associata]MEA5107803.1 alpha-amylase family glycosyl hydrolase [Sphaerochaeta associata]
MITRDFRISVRTRTEMDFFPALFPSDSDLSLLYKQATEIAHIYNSKVKAKGGNDWVSAGKLHATAVLHQLYQSVLSRYLSDSEPDFFTRLTALINKNHAAQEVLAFYMKEFPSPLLVQQSLPLDFFYEESLRGYFLHQVMQENPALIMAAKPFLSPEGLSFPQASQAVTALLGGYTKASAVMGNSDSDIFSFLTRPAKLYPDSLLDQISYILEAWADLIPQSLKTMLLRAIDFVQEEDKPHFPPVGAGGSPVMVVPDYSIFDHEYEAFTADRNWMPNVIMIAKSTLVWLDQLTKEYGYPIDTLDKIPDQELEKLASRGFTALWLIGLWERSSASKKIKNLCGNPDAEASAYSLKNYEIAQSIGGWQALDNLRQRCSRYHIRLASDMVPNHTGIDGDWVLNHSEYFIQQHYPPFPSYTYDGPNLSSDPSVEIKLEDHYYDRSDAAVTFRRKDLRSGDTTYIFHGNDGTSMPWNDTAQLDFLNPATREAVYQQIKHVASNFPIIRFDAAMTLAKKHIQRLWYPKPGHGGDIAGRTQYGMDELEFNQKIPQEFWREVVDRINEELPDTLLLAEAFWMMEGYFVRTLGMHRVYNSAFMNMLKNQENQKYRETIKNTIAFEPEILKRFVNFMNNPDEETALAQFGDGDKYFGVCTLLSTMPGLPMFGHGQIEGYREKYGMEYRRAYWDEKPNQYLVDEHYRRIFPLLKRRYLFSGVDYFQLFDLYREGNVQQSAFCYVNGNERERALVFYNNQYESVEGWIKTSCPKLQKIGEEKRSETVSLGEALGLTVGGRRYLIYDSFNEGLTYMRPSLRVYDEGMAVHLRGFETKVLLNIREVEDVDGTYSELYEQIGESGIANLEQEILALRLKPVYKAMESFHSENFFKQIRLILNGEATSKSERKLILTLAEAYAHLAAAVENLHPAAQKSLPSLPKDVSPAQMLSQVQRYSNLFKREENRAFLHGSRILDEMEAVVAASFFLKPFLGDEATISEAMRASDTLLLSRFFSKELCDAGFTEEAARKACHSAAILASAAFMVDDGMEDPKQILALLLSDSSLAKYAQVNEYQGVTWYTKEAMQEIIYLSALSLAVIKGMGNVSSYIRILMEAEMQSGYKLDQLLG